MRVIWCVEDSPTDSVLLKQALCEAGYQVEVFPSFELFWDAMKYAAARDLPEIILMEVVVGGKEAGWAAMLRVNELPWRSGIKAAFLTSLPYDHYKWLADLGKPDQYWEKPFTAEELVEEVSHLFTLPAQSF